MIKNQLRSDFFIGVMNVGFMYTGAFSGVISSSDHLTYCSSLDWIDVAMSQSHFFAGFFREEE
ncbi:hypothetical protein [Priestia sp. D3YE.R1]|uniref:hypothetical protein n=1 Tax=Priestia sp. D3YE.R1 TaxID=3400416 RepID=UPI0030E576E5